MLCIPLVGNFIIGIGDYQRSVNPTTVAGESVSLLPGKIKDRKVKGQFNSIGFPCSQNIKKVTVDINRLDSRTKKEWSGSRGQGEKYTLIKKDRLNVEYLIKQREEDNALRECWGDELYGFFCDKKLLVEKLASDFYSFLSADKFFIPKTRLLMDKGY